MPAIELLAAAVERHATLIKVASVAFLGGLACVAVCQDQHLKLVNSLRTDLAEARAELRTAELSGPLAELRAAVDEIEIGGFTE